MMKRAATVTQKSMQQSFLIVLWQENKTKKTEAYTITKSLRIRNQQVVTTVSSGKVNAENKGFGWKISRRDLLLLSHLYFLSISSHLSRLQSHTIAAVAWTANTATTTTKERPRCSSSLLTCRFLSSSPRFRYAPPCSQFLEQSSSWPPLQQPHKAIIATSRTHITDRHTIQQDLKLDWECTSVSHHGGEHCQQQVRCRFESVHLLFVGWFLFALLADPRFVPLESRPPLSMAKIIMFRHVSSYGNANFLDK